ncbi:transposase, partial [Actinomadura geliboluensis]|uniref:transposase n=1 Tax=Actinomadura geliboluensis TaxID=882440 RepID=UPI0036B31C0C
GSSSLRCSSCLALLDIRRTRSSLVSQQSDREGGDAPAVQAGEGISGQVTDPGHQPTQHLTEEIDDLNKHLAAAVEEGAPGLLEVRGVGPDSAAALLIAAGDNPERLSSEASFAALCGTSPVEASSGKTQRLRLDRGGDRQANSALYRIVLSHLRWAHHTQDYLRRRLTQGKTGERSSAARNDMWPERSTDSSSGQMTCPPQP